MRQIRNSLHSGRAIVTGWLLCLIGRHDWGRWHSYKRGDLERIGKPRTWRKCQREGCRVYEEGPVDK